MFFSRFYWGRGEANSQTNSLKELLTDQLAGRLYGLQNAWSWAKLPRGEGRRQPHLFWRNKLGLGGAGPINSCPPPLKEEVSFAYVHCQG